MILNIFTGRNTEPTVKAYQSPFFFLNLDMNQSLILFLIIIIFFYFGRAARHTVS